MVVHSIQHLRTHPALSGLSHIYYTLTSLLLSGFSLLKRRLPSPNALAAYRLVAEL